MHSNHILQMPVLVLNASYEPINICGARRALVLVLKGIARTEEEHGLTLHAQRSLIAMPSVIRLLEYRRIPHQTRALSRKEHPSARSQHVPILRRGFRPGELTLPCHSPFARRKLHLGEPCGLLPWLQSPQGQPHAACTRTSRSHNNAIATSPLTAGLTLRIGISVDGPIAKARECAWAVRHARC